MSKTLFNQEREMQNAEAYSKHIGAFLEELAPDMEEREKAYLRSQEEAEWQEILEEEARR